MPPVCTDFATSSDPFPKPDPKDPRTDPNAKAPVLPAWADPDRPHSGTWEVNVRRVGEFFHTTLADAAQSGAGRTPDGDETGDYYPVPLSTETLRPGTIFADPYGHVLVVAHRVPQTPTSGGILLAVDGQPDGTVARKRFWRGNFLFAIDPALGSAGFKRFRPVLRDRITGKWRHLGNAELPDYSTEQSSAGVEGFYDRMDDVLSPAPLDPAQALLEILDALEEQVKTRVRSVDNGRKFLASGKAAADMPEGAKISRPRATGRTSPRRRAICASSSRSTSRARCPGASREGPSGMPCPRGRRPTRSRRPSRRASRPSSRRASSPTRAPTAPTGRSPSGTSSTAPSRSRWPTTSM